jgi:hypothetical protein
MLPVRMRNREATCKHQERHVNPILQQNQAFHDPTGELGYRIVK